MDLHQLHQLATDVAHELRRLTNASVIENRVEFDKIGQKVRIVARRVQQNDGGGLNLVKLSSLGQALREAHVTLENMPGKALSDEELQQRREQQKAVLDEKRYACVTWTLFNLDAVHLQVGGGKALRDLWTLCNLDTLTIRRKQLDKYLELDVFQP